MKRYATLIGGIISVVYDIIYIILMLVGIAVFLDLLKEVENNRLLAVLNLIDALLATVALVFNSLAITSFDCSHEKYLAKKRPLIITAIIINSVIIGISVMAFANRVNFNIVIMFLVSLLAVIMYIIDLAQEDKRYLNEVVIYDEEEESKND